MIKSFLKIFYLIVISNIFVAATEFQYVGCYTDHLDNRLFTEVTYMDGTLSSTNCVSYCKRNQYVYAGLEWGRDCRCGNSLKDRKTYPKLSEGRCSMSCPGNPTEKCGEFSVMSVYKTGYKGEEKKLS